MLDDLKKSVYEANLELVRHGLVILTWGNASGIDRSKGIVAIKPSGVPYDLMKWTDIVLIDLDGKLVESINKPSSDAPTHLIMYNEFPELGGIVHTHSTMATSWAQAGMSIPAFGTTHSDYFYGTVPCTRGLTEQEVNGDYEKETGKVIIETLRKNKIKPLDVPAILVNSHGPFTWGANTKEAVHNAVVLEEIAKMAYYTDSLNKQKPIDQYLLDKHYLRKHGPDSYYGQKR